MRLLTLISFPGVLILQCPFKVRHNSEITLVLILFYLVVTLILHQCLWLRDRKDVWVDTNIFFFFIKNKIWWWYSKDSLMSVDLEELEIWYLLERFNRKDNNFRLAFPNIMIWISPFTSKSSSVFVNRYLSDSPAGQDNYLENNQTNLVYLVQVSRSMSTTFPFYHFLIVFQHIHFLSIPWYGWKRTVVDMERQIWYQ